MLGLCKRNRSCDRPDELELCTVWVLDGSVSSALQVEIVTYTYLYKTSLTSALLRYGSILCVMICAIF